LSELVAAVVGGFLAAGAGWFLQNRLEASRIARMRKLLLVGVGDDLKSSGDLYDRVLDEWDKSGTVWFTTINELRESRQVYLKNREMLVLLNREDLRQRIFKYYHRSAEFLGLLENQQRRKYDIQNRLNELIRELQLRDHELTREAALGKAVPLMQAEDQELSWINVQLPQNVQRARDFKAEAKELLGELAK
jgi:hypothetical protein